MGLETGTSIAALNALWPLGSDPRSQGDDHLRLIKSVLKNDAASRTSTATQVFAGELEASPYITVTRASGDPYFRLIKSQNASGDKAFGITVSAEGGLTFRPLDDLLGISEPIAARMEKAGPGTFDQKSIMTREKGDARYTQVSSQRRLKEGIDRDAPPDAFWTLQPASFVWGGSMDEFDPRLGQPGYSLIAEEVETVFPSAVTRDEEGAVTGLELKALVAALYHEVCRLRGLAAGDGAPA